MTNEEIIDSLKTSITSIAKACYKLFQLKLTEKFVIISSKVILLLLSFCFSLLMLLFMSLGLSWYIGEQLDNVALGYVVTGGIYFILLIILVGLRKKLMYPFLRNFITRELYD